MGVSVPVHGAIVSTIRPLPAVWRFERRTVHGHPEFTDSQKLGEELIDSWMLAIVPESLSMVKRNDTVRSQIEPIPCLGIIPIDPQELANRLNGCFKISIWNNRRRCEISFFGKEGVICSRQNRHAPL